MYLEFHKVDYLYLKNDFGKYVKEDILSLLKLFRLVEMLLCLDYYSHSNGKVL